MKHLTMILCAALALFTGIAFAADVTGDWTAHVNGPDGNSMTLSYHFKQDGGKLTGTVEGPGGSLPVQDGVVDGEKLSFSVTFNAGNGDMKILNEGTMKGEDISLTVKVNGESYGGPITLKKSK
jgi:hypothetical protein